MSEVKLLLSAIFACGSSGSSFVLYLRMIEVL